MPRAANHRQAKGRWSILAVLLGILAGTAASAPAGAAAVEQRSAGDFRSLVAVFASFGDRSTGTEGNRKAAEFVKTRLADLGFDAVKSHEFSVPVIRHGESSLVLPERNLTLEIQPLRANAITPEALAPPGLEGPLIYVGPGELGNFNDKDISGAVIMMDMDSGKNWLHAADLGARALIYVDRGPTDRIFFEEKFEISPIQFPRFWISFSEARRVFGDFEKTSQGLAASRVRLTSRVNWENAKSENIYVLIPGVDKKLMEELVVVEAFYGSTALVPGSSPGADEASSIATLLELAGALKRNPPGRSVLLAATGGHDQALAGMRELVWSLWATARDQRDLRNTLGATVKKAQTVLGALKKMKSAEALFEEAGDASSLAMEALRDRLKTEVDIISQKLIQLRMQRAPGDWKEEIQELVRQRLLLRRLIWQGSFKDLTPEENQVLRRILPSTIKEQEAVLGDAKRQVRELKSAGEFRSLVKSLELGVIVSLHLSSHGDGIGAFDRGWLYHPLLAAVNRQGAYYALDEALRQSAATVQKDLGLPALFQDTLRPSQLHPWQTYFFDRPFLGGEVSALAGNLGISLATVHDARYLWGTPYDLPETIDWEFARQQSALIGGLIQALSRTPRLQTDRLPRNGFATVTGRANFLRQGELFADQPAPGSIMMGFQGTSRYYALVDSMGGFQIKGVADRRHLLDKVIIEGYRFEPETGAVEWAIDKKKSGKEAYRLRIRRRSVGTDLVMFACEQSTFFNLMEPRNFQYLTKMQILDGRRDALPLRYWYSRIDTRASNITSLFLESGTTFKTLLSDSVLNLKMILTNATADRPEGSAYLIDAQPFLHRTTFQAARDMAVLIGPRIANLESHGIVDERIHNLHQRGIDSLKKAEQSLKEKKFDLFSEAAEQSWAMAIRVYAQVEKTQKDVLFGVLFYIALFVPFTFCLERLLFSFSNIYKRIIAFGSILILLIAVIYKVHPAFQLAYSPMVVILAFFIIGLSLVVTLIIFFRFEDEMAGLQRQAQHMKALEISPWKAFIASFFLGVTNLRRRRIRTALTCITLIILTFTIMSFTTVKTVRHHARLWYQDTSPYRGFMLKKTNWQNLPPAALGKIINAFEGKGEVTPRVWMESEDRTRTVPVPIGYQGRSVEAQAMVGLGALEGLITGIDKILVAGRWLAPEDRRAVLLSERLASGLGIEGIKPGGTTVQLWGMPFQVVGIFAGEKFQNHLDMDGEPLTPVTFPSEIFREMTEVEMEAAESGEEIQAFQTRYQHVAGELTVIIPYATLLAAGGYLKSVAVKPDNLEDMPKLAQELTDRFGLTLFSGEEKGTFLYTASDTLSYSGVPNIVIPLIISILIVLNTMIGSVYERKGEIGIYTSVGLAPSHVSFLFVAEAMAFAVLSVVFGYLLAQISASLFAGTSLWAGITVNYSSLAGVAAMFLVILVVLISVIYPSRVAARIAIPDVNRSWSLPAARGNVMEITLPFLMNYREHRSIGGFLYDYFRGHQDVSQGDFSTGRLDFTFVCPTPPGVKDVSGVCLEEKCCREACLKLSMEVWLAPFDFGIMQLVDLQFCPAAEEPGYLEIKINLNRLAGEADSWRRINKAFLNAVRRQILLWRSLDETSQDHYEKLLAAAQREKEDGETLNSEPEQEK